MFTSVVIREMQNKISKEYHNKLTPMVKINHSEIPSADETWSRGNSHIKWCTCFGKLQLKIFIPYDPGHPFVGTNLEKGMHKRTRKHG